MSQENREAVPAPQQPNRTRQLQILAASSAAGIVSLQSVVFAAQTHPIAQPQATQILEAPILSPQIIATAGAVIATLGAYRLRKARQRDGRAAGDSTER